MPQRLRVVRLLQVEGAQERVPAAVAADGQQQVDEGTMFGCRDVLWPSAQCPVVCRELCVQRGPRGHDGTVQCRCNARWFSIGTGHTFFFLPDEAATLCSPVPVELAQRREFICDDDRKDPVRCYSSLCRAVRARPPLDLTTQDAGDGGRRLSWSSPYPSSSSLNQNLTYRLSYRADGQDNWTVSTDTSLFVKLKPKIPEVILDVSLQLKRQFPKST